MNGTSRSTGPSTELTPLLAGSSAPSASTMAQLSRSNNGGPGSGGGTSSANSSGGGAGQASRPHHSQATIWITVIAFVCLSGITYKLLTSGALEQFLLAVDRDPYGFLLLFIVFYIIAVVMMFPTMILQVLCGALYNFYAGLLVSWFATSVGQSLAFLLGRYLFRQSVKAYLLDRVPNFPNIEVAVKKEGWKLMCLLRLSPILPYNVLNYAAALTPIPFLSYTLSSSLSVIPWTALYVYLGTFTTNVADLLQGKINYADVPHDGVHMLSSVLYMVLLVITIVYGYVLSKRAINSALKSAADEGPGSGSEPV